MKNKFYSSICFSKKVLLNLFYFFILFSFIFSSQNAFANGAIGYKGVYINNKGTKTWYKAHNVAWGYNGCGNYQFNSASDFSGINLGNFSSTDVLQISGFAVVGWTDNSDWVSGRLQYKIWKQGTTEPGTWNNIDVGNYGNCNGATQVVCTSGIDRIVGYDNGTTNIHPGSSPGVYNFKIQALGRMQYNCGNFNTNDGSEVTATFTITGFTSSQAGNWSSTSTWTGGIVPSSGSEVYISHNVTLDQNAVVSSLTINSGATFTASDNSPRVLTIAPSSSTTSLTNNGTWSNGASTNTVVFSASSGSNQLVNTTSGSIGFNNVIINKSGGTSNNVGMTFGTNATIIGTLEIGSGGFINSDYPGTSFWGSNSILKFNTGGTYNVPNSDKTWPATTNLPPNIEIASTNLNLNDARTSGNLNISGGSLVLGANLTINGNWTRANTATFTPNTFTVTLSGSSAQTIQITGGGTSTQYSLIINNSSGVSLGSSTNLTVTNALALTSGALTTNGNSLTLNSGIAITRGTGTISTVPTFAGTSSITYTTGGVTTDNELNTSVTSLSCTNTSGTVTLKSGASLTATTASNVSGGTFLVPITSTLILGGGFSNAGTLTINGNLQLNASSFILNSAGFTYGSSGNLIYNTGGSYTMSNEWPSSSGPNNVTIQNSGTNLSMGSARSISASGTLIVSSGSTLTTGGNLTLQSNATGTARVGNSAGTISGAVIVERYIPARRAWRLLTAPLRGNGSDVTLSSAWQTNNSTGVLLFAPGGANGFTAGGANANIQSYNSSTNTWSYLTGTNNNNIINNDGGGTTATNKAYAVFVTGPSNTTNITSGSTATTIKTTGKIVTGQQNLSISNTNGQYNLIGNPYASPIDLESFYTTNSTPISSTFYVWDAQLATVGSYITVTRTGANTFTYSPNNGTQYRYIQSGQAFFVSSNGGGNSVSFQEAHKVSNGITTFFRGGATNSLSTNISFKNPDNSWQLADGFTAIFDNSNSADVNDEFDVIKFTNSNETVSLIRSNKKMAIEARPLPTSNDTLFINQAAMRQFNYKFDFNPTNLNAAGLDAFLQDAYTNSQTQISLSNTSSYEFVVNTDAASSAANRFRIVFKPSTTLPVNITSIKATQKDNNVIVDWTVENELNIKEYQVQKSTDGSNFDGLNTVKANNSKAYSSTDFTPVQGANYYRVMSIGDDGSKKYSNIVVVKMGGRNSIVSIYPNPIKGNTVNLQLQNIDKGDYEMQVINTLGQVLFSKLIQHNGGSATQTIQLPNNFAKGNYVMKLANQEKIIFTDKIIIE
jgi:hypothetical protein